MHIQHNTVISKKKLGVFGEQKMIEYLQKSWYHVRETNFSCMRGEIDIIASKGDVLAFIEVKTRMQELFNLSEIVTVKKQKKIIYTAQQYIMQHQLFSMVHRFDIGIIIFDGTDWKINYITDAFTENWEYTL